MKKIFKLICFIIIIISLSGCYDYKEINEYAIVSAISIDKSEKKDKKYTIGIQIMNAKKDEESENSSIAFYKNDGNTVYEALQKMIIDLPKQLYLGHNEVVIISEELLKEQSALDYLDYFMRDSEVEKDSLIIIAKEDKALNVLKVITPLETIPSRNLKETIKVADDYKGTFSTITLDEFISKLSNDGEDSVLPSVKITGKIKDGEKVNNISKSDPDTKLKLSNMGYFKNHKLKGYLTNEEEEGYKILSNIANGTYINVKCDDDNYATIRIKKSKSKETLLFKNKKPYVKIKTKISGRLIEYNCKANFLKDKKKVKELEEKANRKIIKLTNKALDKLYNENNSDALSYGKKYYSRKYKKIKILNIKKKDVSKNISFSVKPNVKIERIGLTIKSIKEANNNE